MLHTTYNVNPLRSFTDTIEKFHNGVVFGGSPGQLHLGRKRRRPVWFAFMPFCPSIATISLTLPIDQLAFLFTSFIQVHIYGVLVRHLPITCFCVIRYMFVCMRERIGSQNLINCCAWLLHAAPVSHTDRSTCPKTKSRNRVNGARMKP